MNIQFRNLHLIFPILFIISGYSQDSNLKSCIELLNNNQAAKALSCAKEIEYKAEKPLDQSQAKNIQGKALLALKNPQAKSKFEESNALLKSNHIDNQTLINENDNFIRLASMMFSQNNLNHDDLQSKMMNSTTNNAVKSGKNPVFEIVTNENKKLNSSLIKEKEIKAQLISQKDSLKTIAHKILGELNEMSQEQLKQQIIMQEQTQEITNIHYQDSIRDIQFKVQDLEIKDAANQQRYYFMFACILLLILAGCIHTIYSSKKYTKLLKEKNATIASEKERADELLLNILPETIVTELKEKGYVNAKHYEEVSVCFIDFVSFSTMAESQHPQQILDELNTCFKKFDEIISKYDLEKIKTIGDCYMCAGGLPDSDKGHQIKAMVMANKEIMEWLMQWNEVRISKGKKPYYARSGIHCGPVAAGVVGTKKFAYDIWGDAVNISARMEQSGTQNRINVSEFVYNHLKNEFNFSYRGEIEAKNKGLLKMYFLET